MMGKRHYEALATILVNATDVDQVRKGVADMCAAENPRFDRQKFLQAAGGDQ